MSLTNSQAAHVWAQQIRERGQSGNGNLNFRWDTIYSYSTPIGKFQTNEAGERCILITSRGFSVSTSQHVDQVLNAVRGLPFPIFRVDLATRGGYAKTPREIMQGFHAEYTAKLCLAAKARSKAIMHLRDAELILQSATEFAQFFGLPAPNYKPLDAEEIAAIKAKAKADNKAKKEREAQRQAEMLNAAIEAEAAWLCHERAYLPYYLPNIERNTLMRISKTGDAIETSRGASFPIDHALKAFPLIRRAIGHGWKRNGHTIHLGHFQIDEILTDGTVKAGCHTVHYDQIERIARQLGLEA